jgi:two-component system response regulator
MIRIPEEVSMPDEGNHFVLIAEDDPDDRLLLEQGIQNSEFKSQIAYRFVCTGPETLDYLENEQNPRPDLIILDLNMPMNGRRVLSVLSGSPNLRKIPVVVFTTAASKEEVGKAYAQCANSYLVKPSGFNELVEKLNQVFSYWFVTLKMPGEQPAGH